MLCAITEESTRKAVARVPNIRDVMTTEPTTFPATASLVEAAQAMRQEDIGDVIVLDQNNQICGIITDRDMVVRAMAEE
jgi:CBS domain-containing protein